MTILIQNYTHNLHNLHIMNNIRFDNNVNNLVNNMANNAVNNLKINRFNEVLSILEYLALAIDYNILPNFIFYIIIGCLYHRKHLVILTLIPIYISSIFTYIFNIFEFDKTIINIFTLSINPELISRLHKYHNITKSSIIFKYLEFDIHNEFIVALSIYIQFTCIILLFVSIMQQYNLINDFYQNVNRQHTHNNIPIINNIIYDMHNTYNFIKYYPQKVLCMFLIITPLILILTIMNYETYTATTLLTGIFTYFINNVLN